MKDIYVDFKAGGIKGDSKDKDHAGTVEVTSFSHEIRQPKSATSSTAGGHTSERVEHGEMIFTKDIDFASPALLVACSSGTVIKDVEIHFYRAFGSNTAGGSQNRKKYWAIKLKNVIVASVSNVISGEGLPGETFSLKYSAIEWSYDEIKVDGSQGNKMTKQWNLQNNTPTFA
ncbi:MAG TPA: type VI secretion system tube protein Hcp [Rhizobacter sp.]